MTPSGLAERAERIVAARRPGVADRHQVAAALREAEQAKAWLDAQIAGLIARLGSLESFPEQTIAETSRCSLGAAGKTKERSDTLTRTPTLADALAEGAITAGHVDAVTRATKKLETASEVDELIDRVEALVDVAAAGTIDAFSRRLDLEVRKIRSDDGEERLARQQRQARLSHWVDGDGMWNLRGRFDPVTGNAMAARLERVMRRLFTGAVPEHCPSDPVAKNEFLLAQACAHLVTHRSRGDGGRRGRSDGRPEFVAVIDVDARPGAGPEITFPIPIEVPDRILAELAETATVAAVVVRNGVVLHAPGVLDLGRTTRLASPAQRRALRALYRGCAVPGCMVAYDRCKLHHVLWWRHGGRTDLANLLPVCAKHHSAIHRDGWTVGLGPNRELTITLTDGRVMSTGPPSRRAA